jgi:hypothetical protein
MKVKNIRDEHFNNYKKASMFIGFPYCTFKCDKECGEKVCQNSELANLENIDISYSNIINRYLSNNLTSALVFGGLEPLDSWEDLILLIQYFRKVTDDDIVIYTGYNKNEIEYYIQQLSQYKNIIVKFGRFKPNQQKHYDEILGIYLASDNQYGERIS